MRERGGWGFYTNVHALTCELADFYSTRAHSHVNRNLVSHRPSMDHTGTLYREYNQYSTTE
jgi:hypothetical protein